MNQSAQPRILIVDDNLEFKSMLQDRLSTMGFSVLEQPADTLVKILDVIQSAGVDAIVLDIHMPGLNGFDVLKAIRKISPNFPAIMMTGSKNSFSMQRAMELGCNSLIEKPCKIEDLAQDLHQLIKDRRQDD